VISDPTMLPGPIFFHELRAIARRKRSYALRVLLGLFLLYSVVMSYESWTGSYWYSLAVRERELTPKDLARLGNQLFVAVVWLQGLTICFLTPAFLAGAVAEDRQRKVLPYLLASPMTGAEIVLGKLAVRVMNLAVLVAVGLPVLSLTTFLGGIDPLAVWLAYGASFSTLYFLAALSIFLSVYSPRPRDSILVAYLLVVIWSFLPMLDFLFTRVGGPLSSAVNAARPVTEWIMATSPYTLLVLSFTGASARLVEGISWMIGLQVLYGTILMGWSTWRLRPVERGARPLGLPIFPRDRGVPQRRLLRRRTCGDEPMMWKECTGSLSIGSRSKAVTLFLLSVVAIVGLGYLVVDQGIPAFHEMHEYGTGAAGTWRSRWALNFSVRTITAILYILTSLMLGASAATGITMEHEKDTWVSLVSTPLDRTEILKAKVLGAFWRVRAPLAALASVWLTGVCCGAVHPLGALGAAVAVAIYSTFTAMLGTYVSLRFKSSARAIATTIATLIFLNGGYLFCCIPFIAGSDSIVVMAGFTPFIVTAAPFTASELDAFFSMTYSGAVEARSGAIVMVITSFGSYASAGFILWNVCLSQFELAVDRPMRSAPPYPTYVDSRGITFVDDHPTHPSAEPTDDDAEPLDALRFMAEDISADKLKIPDDPAASRG
jgi:ABC-type transport system involved in multi-copper enzyme maturation permease subunit